VVVVVVRGVTETVSLVVLVVVVLKLVQTAVLVALLSNQALHLADLDLQEQLVSKMERDKALVVVERAL
jgi:hypothetical protein